MPDSYRLPGLRASAIVVLVLVSDDSPDVKQRHEADELQYVFNVYNVCIQCACKWKS